jgi:RNA 2',3'-cyclic 3'-phosphodiesterase
MAEQPEVSMRLFIAADVPDAVREALAALQARISAALGRSGTLKWVKPEHAHLTLVFLGNVDDARVPAVVETVAAAVDLPGFEVAFEGVGVFPPRGAPRVLWVGVGRGDRELVELQRMLASRIAALGLPLEDRPFHPHLTLARWRESRSSDRDRAIAAAPRGVAARAHVDGATLYQSRLSPAGPTYTALARANLTGHHG